MGDKRIPAAVIVLAALLELSCSTRAPIDGVVKGFFGEINASNFESAKAKYLSVSLINELNASSPMRALAPLHKKVQESFQRLAGGIDSVETGNEAIKGEQATVTATLIMKWGTKETGSIDLIKEEGKTWKISEWGEFKALGSEHASNAARFCNARNVDAAIPEYQAALAENPNDSMTVYSLGTCYHFLGKLNEAEAEIKRAIQMHPDAVWDPYLRLGGIAQGRGEIVQAEQAYQRAIKNKPDYAPAYNVLAWMYADKGIKLDRAIELAQKALELAPNDANILDTLGWAYYRKGDRTQALKYLASEAGGKPGRKGRIRTSVLNLS
jgi:tetratricopeptide (TPR) repeat protein